MEKRKILIDCDGGADALVALLYALRCPELEVIGVTTVAGVCSAEQAAELVGRTLTLAGHADIPYASGSETPLVRQPMTARFGQKMDFLSAGKTAPSPENGPDMIRTVVRTNPGEVTLVALGPLTNLARALLAEYTLAGKIREIVCMGGAFAYGNSTPKAEFNVYSDPHAARFVFESPIPVRLVTLDAVRTGALEEDEIRSALSDTPLARILGRAWDGQHCKEELSGRRSLCDLGAMLTLLHPEVFRMQECWTDVVLSGGCTLGQSIFDVTGVSGHPANVSVALDVDREAYQVALRAALGSL